jgi:hypothetical protein
MNSQSTFRTLGEVSTAALINRALAEFDLSQLEQVETRLEAAIQSGLLKQQGRAVLQRVRGVIARRRLVELFDSSESSGMENGSDARPLGAKPQPTPTRLQHFALP